MLRGQTSFRHRWLANLRVLEIYEIKSVPLVPVWHPFVERLIGTLRRELRDRLYFWNALDLERKQEFRNYYNHNRVISYSAGAHPRNKLVTLELFVPRLIPTDGGSVAEGWSRRRSAFEWEYARDRKESI